MYSLRTAAEAVGRGKPAILKAIQKGKISAKRNELGEWEIDPAELHRVYPLIPKEALKESPVERREIGETAGEIKELRVRLEAMHELKARMEDECADLRRRLDQTEEARRKAEDAKDRAFGELSRLTLMLTHEGVKPQPEPAAQGPETPKKAWYRRLFG